MMTSSLAGLAALCDPCIVPDSKCLCPTVKTNENLALTSLLPPAETENKNKVPILIAMNLFSSVNAAEEISEQIRVGNR